MDIARSRICAVYFNPLSGNRGGNLMALFLAGITLFCVVHLFPAMAPASRENLVFKLGENTYKGIYSTLILAGLLMIVFGWKSAYVEAVYVPPLQPGLLPALLVFLGLVLFFASQMQGHIKRVLRHPQMIGTILWACAHLLVNGDSRSLTLFGSLAVWALIEIVLCNRRDGPRSGLPVASAKTDLFAVLAGGLVFALVARFHATLFGVSSF
jgi:uncharacterized membrane protein